MLEFLISSLIELTLYGASCAVIVSAIYPPLNGMLDYGKTLQKQPNYWWEIYVPKLWFTQFYLLSLSLALLNFFLLKSSSATVVSALVLLHSLRRTYECLWVFTLSPGAKIHITHWIAGVWFYGCLNAAIWTIKDASVSLLHLPLVALFLYAQIRQNRHHRILSETKKYLFPKKFGTVCCPHYTDEMLIYGLLNLIVDLPTRNFNRAFFAIWIWVCVNLSVLGWRSRKFYGTGWAIIEGVF